MRTDLNPKMGKEDFAFVNLWSRLLTPLFAADFTQQALLNFLQSRTIAFGKYGENIKPSHFSVIAGRGYLQVGPGYNLTERWRRQLISILESRGLVMRDPGDRNFYLLNLPGMMRVWAPMLETVLTAEAWGRAQEVFHKVQDDYEVFFPWAMCPNIRMEYNMDDFKEQIDAGLAKSAKANERKRLQRDARPTLRAGDVPRFLKEKCEEHGMSYYEEWTKKLKGQLNNWLKSCLNSGVDERVALSEAVQCWSYFHSGQLNRDDGTPITLRSLPSFEEFYKYRHQISTWLLTNRDYLEGFANRFGKEVWKTVTLEEF